MYVNHHVYGGRSYPSCCSASSGQDLWGRLLFLQQQPSPVVEIGRVWSHYYSGQPNLPPSNSNCSNPILFSSARVPKPKGAVAILRSLKAHQLGVAPDQPAGEANQLSGPAGAERKKNSKKMVLVELVGAFNEVTQRMMTNNVHVQISTSSSRLLFQTLKLSIPLLLHLHHYHHHHHQHHQHQPRSPLSKALSVALILADLQMDAEVISAAILRQAVEAGAIAPKDVGHQIGAPTAHLLHESLRVKNIPAAKSQVLDVLDLDDQSAAAFRKYCLTYYDVRALILDLAVKLDTMRHDLHRLPRYQQQIFSLQVIRIHAPLAHALGLGASFLSPELEDLSFRYLFPFSYLYVDSWLCRNHQTGLMDVYRDELLRSLNADLLLSEMVDNISVEGRYKTRCSTMKKLLSDGRRPEQVNDILGLRVILRPTPGVNEPGSLGERACYRTREIIQSVWKEVPHRTKDYISMPKANGYKSLHLAVDVNDNGGTVPLMEIQIRTTEMDMLAAGGTASHSLYKGGLIDPEEAKKFKAIMIAAAEFAALRLKDIPTSGHNKSHRDPVFCLIDKNADGKISIEELAEVMVELGARGEDAKEMMQLFDSNSDGTLSSDEFDLFQRQVEMIRNLEGRDDQFRSLLNEKLQMTESCDLIHAHRERVAVS